MERRFQSFDSTEEGREDEIDIQLGFFASMKMRFMLTKGSILTISLDMGLIGRDLLMLLLLL